MIYILGLLLTNFMNCQSDDYRWLQYTFSDTQLQHELAAQLGQEPYYIVDESAISIDSELYKKLTAENGTDFVVCRLKHAFVYSHDRYLRLTSHEQINGKLVSRFDFVIRTGNKPIGSLT